MNESEENRPDLAVEPFVRQLDPGVRGSQVVPFRGYAIQAVAGGPILLYLTAELLDFIEIAPADVSWNERLEADAPLNASVLWVREEATVEYHRPDSPRLDPDYFQGPITAGDLAYAAQVSCDEDVSEAAVRFMRISRTPRCTTIWTCDQAASRPCCPRPTT